MFKAGEVIEKHLVTLYYHNTWKAETGCLFEPNLDNIVISYFSLQSEVMSQTPSHEEEEEEEETLVNNLFYI